MTIVNYKIENFIGIFETDCDTDVFINYFENVNIHDRQKIVDSRESPQVFFRNDRSLGLHPHKDSGGDNQNLILCNLYDDITWQCLNIYLKEHNYFHNPPDSIRFINTHARKIQKTNIGGGYHRFHEENGKIYNRWATTSLYLNDVDDGGETQFIYQNIKIKPKKGVFLIFPAGYTHLHRGNPPLSNEKYIVTSWISFK